jgi:hypothetical protein
MAQLPPRQQQIVQTHAQLIVAAVQCAAQHNIPPQFEHALQTSANNGWTALVAVIRKIIAGDRSAALLQPLDEEDRTIAEAILNGIQNPATLPDPNAQADPTLATPGMAAMIHAARSGQAEALHLLGNMAEQMTAAGGEMAQLGGIMKRLVDGERDIEILTKGMGAQGESLVTSLLQELGKLESH